MKRARRSVCLCVPGRQRLDLKGSWAGPKETVENVTAIDDPLDVSKLMREERDELKRHLVADYPDAARALGLVRADVA